MKIVLLNTSELSGGAAIACKRLMAALKKNGVEVKMLVRDKQTEDSNVVSINKNFYIKVINIFRFLRERLVIWINNRFSKDNLFAVSIADTGNNLINNELVQQADIIHIHWINQGFLSLPDLEKLVTSGKPVVWTMHDQWAYTGICHYTGGCDEFANLCSHCPKLMYSGKHDLSYKTFKKKENLYKSGNITFVGCSKWITNEAKRSFLCREINMVSIPNPIDIKIYTKQNKDKTREALGLPFEKKLILFGACKVTDKRKGFNYLKDACDILLEQNKFSQEDLAVVVFGGKSIGLDTLLPYPVHSLGYINNIQTIVNMYNAVDLFFIPSLEDNLPNTIMEAMSCGTPCVGFNTGGISEMIDHKINGYVAIYKSAEDLAEGIHWILSEASYEQLSRNARQKVIDCYSEEIVSEEYISLYKTVGS